jgi:outer membrane immunogenic protein
MNRTILFAGIVLGLGIGRGLAADLVVKVPLPPAPDYSWTGFYVGLNAGGAWGRDRVNTEQFFPVPPFFAVDRAAISGAASPTFNPSSFTGGAQAGYNLQYDQWLFGLEGDFEYLGLKGSRGGTFPFPSTPATFFSTATNVSTNWLFTLRPRLGWIANNWLIYATGGLAVGNEKFTQIITLLSPGVETASFSTTRTGWTVGGGVEYALPRNWSVKGEYLYVDYGAVNTTGNVNVPQPPPFFTASSVHLTTNIVRVGLNYQFH